MFGGGLDAYLDWPIEDIMHWHPQAIRHFDLRAQSTAASIATLFAPKR